MKICLATIGSDGDVQPFLALARGLLARGHQVTLTAQSRYGARAASLGVPFMSVGPTWDDRLMEEQFGAVLREKDPMKQLQMICEVIKGEMKPMVPQFLDFLPGHDALVSHPIQIAAIAAARVTGTPYAGAHLSNTMRSRHINPLGSDLGRLLNALLWRGAGFMARRATDGPLNEVVRAAGLDPWRDIFFDAAYSRKLDMLAVSPQVIAPDPLWPSTFHATGYWFLEEPAFTPDPDLAAFMEAERPVVITFGSMAGSDAETRTAKLFDALRRLGRPAVLQSGWANLGEGDLPPNVRRIGFVPHGWLFSHAGCVVHHGGAGTTAAALRAGVPQVIVWHMGDQPVWGRLVHRLGVGPKMRSNHQFDGKWLAATLTRVMADEAMKKRASDVGAAVRAEDGVGKAVGLIESFAGSVG
jgi:UDP:flavonoid glycosyltransferase YjiC (YdhE family)